MSEASWAPDPWLAVAVALFVLAVLGLVLLGRRERRAPASTDAKLDALNRRLGAAEKKLETADHDLRNIRLIVNNLPTKESINAIAVQVAGSQGKIDGMQATLHSQTKSLDLIVECLVKTSVETIVANSSEPKIAKHSGDKA